MDKRLKTKLNKVLKESSDYAFQGPAFFPFSSDNLPQFSETFCIFCRHCSESAAGASNCRKVIYSGAYQSYWAGEPYYFRCWCGLNSVIVPVAPEGNLIGALTFGGFFYTEANPLQERQSVSNTIKNLGERAASRLLEKLPSIRTVSTMEVRGSADFLMEALLSSGVNDVQDMTERRNRYLQQRRIGELMQTYGNRRFSSEDVFELFSLIMKAVRDNNDQHVRLLMDDLLCRIFLISAQNLEKVKVQLNHILAMVTSELVMNDRLTLDAAISRQYRAYHELSEIEDVAEISYWAVQQVLLMLGRSPLDHCQNDPLSERVLNWIRTHFNEHITLNDCAEEVGASISSIRKHLKKHTRKNFTQHLLEIRIMEARMLLVNTEMPLAEIAERCGFFDQSHFIRSFRRVEELSPRQFREQSRLPKTS